MKQLKSKKSLIFTSLVFMMGCQAPVITQTGNSGNSTSSNIVGSTGSSVNNETDEQRNNSGSGPKINVNCIPNLNVDTPIGNLATGLPPCPSETNGSPFPTPTPSASPSGSPSPSPSPSGSPSPSPSPTPTPVPTPSGPIGPGINVQGEVNSLGTQQYAYSENGGIVDIGDALGKGVDENFSYALTVDVEKDRYYLGLQDNVILFNDGEKPGEIDDLSNGVNIAGPNLGIASGFKFSQFTGNENSLGDFQAIRFRNPSGSDITVNNSNVNFGGISGTGKTLILLADSGNFAVRLIDPEGDGTLPNLTNDLNAGSSATLISNTSGANFVYITDLAVDPIDPNQLFIVDRGAHKIYLYNFTDKQIELYAGNGTAATNATTDGSNNDGVLPRTSPELSFLNPTAIDINPLNGNIYVAESGIIREIDRNTDQVSIYAGRRLKPSDPTAPEQTVFAAGPAYTTLFDNTCVSTGENSSTFSSSINDLKVDGEGNIFLSETYVSGSQNSLNPQAWFRRISKDCSNITTLLDVGGGQVKFLNRQESSGNNTYNIAPVQKPSILYPGVLAPFATEFSFDKEGNIITFSMEALFVGNQRSCCAFNDGTTVGKPIKISFN